MKRCPSRCGLLIMTALVGVGTTSLAEEPRPVPNTENVLYVTVDGMRWQEVFRGAEERLLNKEDGGVPHVEALKKAYWRSTPEERREALFPFLWTVVARQGQIYGNADRGSVARVTNGLNFSYPGYSEMMTGFVDPRIDSNDKKPNPNINVLEWLDARPGFRGRVAAFGSWDCLPYILNRDRGKLLVNAGWEPIEGDDLNDREKLLNRLSDEVHHPWGDEERLDALTFHVALEHLRRHRPRVLYVSFGQTDTFAHRGRYDEYLREAHQADAFLKEFWDEVQSIPAYRAKTTLIVSTDHGRGDPPKGWRDHGKNVKVAEKIWIAVIGPDTPALGERADVADVTQSQIAPTIAALVGEDYAGAVPKSAKPIEGVLRAKSP